MIVLGIILFIAGLLLHVVIPRIHPWTVENIGFAVGLTLAPMGSMGRAVGGRRAHYLAMRFGPFGSRRREDAVEQPI